jgi:hypothetical protein
VQTVVYNGESVTIAMTSRPYRQSCNVGIFLAVHGLAALQAYLHGYARRQSRGEVWESNRWWNHCLKPQKVVEICTALPLNGWKWCQTPTK